MPQQGKTTWRNFLGSCTASEGTREGAVTCLGDPYRAARPPRAASSWLGHPSSSWCSHQRRPPPSRHAATFPHPEAPRTLATSLREAALLGQEMQKHGKKKKNLHTSGSVCFSSPTCPASSSASCLESIAAPRIHGKKKKNLQGAAAAARGACKEAARWQEQTQSILCPATTRSWGGGEDFSACSSG